MSDHHRLSMHQFVAAEADRVLSELVPMAGEVLKAMHSKNMPLARARTSDCHETLVGLCPAKLQALLVVAAVELARVGWKPDEHPDAADVNPDEPLPANPPEVQWEDGR